MQTLPVEGQSECALDIEGPCSTSSLIEDMSNWLEAKSPLVVEGAGQEELKRREYIVEAMKEATGCDSELCVLTESAFKPRNVGESLKRFKPKGPADSTRLLNNINIDDVLARLTIPHPDFYHLKFQMIDFDKSPKTELGTLDMVKDVIKQGYTTFGVVMNTDKRSGGGIHWFCLFCDFRASPVTIEYFNSSGNLPMKEIQAWIIRTEYALQQAGYKTLVCKLVGMVHQRDSETECGPYSLYYIWNRLNGISPASFQAQRIPDAEMIKFRARMFRS
jgi:hypothetical protein